MKFLQQPIEKKLSNLLGAKVTFERLKISPLTGKLEAEAMVIAGERADRPMVKVRRMDAQIAVAKALKGQIVVKSLLVEGPEILLVRGEDGGLRIPKLPAGVVPKEAEEDGSGWEFAAQSIQVIEGSFCFENGSQVMRMSGISGNFKLRDGRVDLGDVELRGIVGWGK
jgi:uncharacterized protein involved in outer membrane biogenesis